MKNFITEFINWSNFFEQKDVIDELSKIEKKLNNQYDYLFPNKELIFKVFEMSPEKIKVIILGQDPYNNRDLSKGFSFAINNGKKVKIPPSLFNIFKAIKKSYPEKFSEEKKSFDVSLSNWIDQGVFLLNSALTIEKDKPGSHCKMWKNFTNLLIKFIIKKNKDVIFILWGKVAQNIVISAIKETEEEKENDFNFNKNQILSYSHPSPVSGKKFDSCPNFIEANELLKSNNSKIIEWWLI